jgi:hypothetical protein
MALVPLATVEDMETRLGKAIPEGLERDRAQALLADASTLVRHEVGRTWVDAEGDLENVPDVAVMTAISAAIRAWYNPSQIESAQLGAVSIRYGDVWLTAVERDRLGTLNTGRAGTLSLELKHGYGFEGNRLEGWAPYQFNEVGPAPGDWFPIGY